MVELLVGVTMDPAHGFVVDAGAGGTLTEVMADSVLASVAGDGGVRLRPAWDNCGYAPVLAGYRGQAGADMQAIAAAVMAVQDYVTEHAAKVLEVEVNPLIATESRAVAVDALIRVREEE